MKQVVVEETVEECIRIFSMSESTLQYSQLNKSYSGQELGWILTEIFSCRTKRVYIGM